MNVNRNSMAGTRHILLPFLLMALCIVFAGAGQAFAGIQSMKLINNTDSILFNFQYVTFSNEIDNTISGNQGLYLLPGDTHQEDMQNADKILQLTLVTGLQFFTFDEASGLPQDAEIKLTLQQKDNAVWLEDAAGKRYEGRVVPALSENLNPVTLADLLKKPTVADIKNMVGASVGTYPSNMAVPCKIGKSVWVALLFPEWDTFGNEESPYSDDATIGTFYLYAPRQPAYLEPLIFGLKDIADAAPSQVEFMDGDNRFNTWYMELTDDPWSKMARYFTELAERGTPARLMAEILVAGPDDTLLEATLYADSVGNPVMQAHITTPF